MLTSSDSEQGNSASAEVVQVLAEWCLSRPLTPKVLQSLGIQEVRKRWRAIRLALRCRKLPHESDCGSLNLLIEYLRGLAALARQK